MNTYLDRHEKPIQAIHVKFWRDIQEIVELSGFVMQELQVSHSLVNDEPLTEVCFPGGLVLPLDGSMYLKYDGTVPSAIPKSVFEKEYEAVESIQKVDPDHPALHKVESVPTGFVSMECSKFPYLAMPLVPYADHQKRYVEYVTTGKVYTGVACPDCGKELTFIESDSDHSTITIDCSCGWTGDLLW